MVYTDKIHLVADTLAELLAFGRAMGLRPEWIQGWGKKLHNPHFLLIPDAMLVAALKRGAILVDDIKILKIALAMKVDDDSAKLLNELFAPSDLPLMNGRTGQTELL